MPPNVLVEVARLILQRHRETHLLATVFDTSGNTIRVQRDGQSVPEDVFYAAADGLAAAVVAGDRVIVVDATGRGGFVVLARVVA